MRDFWSADVVNMDLTGRDPGPLHSNQPRHVRVIGNDDLAAYVRNEPDEMRIMMSRDGDPIIEPPDAWNETTDEKRAYRLVFHFDAETDLEVRLAVMAIDGFIRRRTSLENVVSVLTED